MRSRLEVFKLSLRSKIFDRGAKNWADKSRSSELLSSQLRSRNYPEWTAWYVSYSDVQNDLWAKSHFNHQVKVTYSLTSIKLHYNLLII